MRLGDRSSSIAMPAGKTDAIFFDDVIPGFGLRLRKSKADGPIARTWVFQFRSPRTGESRRIAFGSPATLGAKKAREHAGRLHAQVKLGNDPSADKQEGRDRAKETFEKHVTVYLAKREAEVSAGRLAQATYDQIKHALKKHWADLNKEPVRDISQQQIAGILNRIKGRIAANRARAWLSTFFAWLMGEGVVASNPVLHTNKPVKKEIARDRVLSDAELVAVYKACPDDDYGKIVRLLILTAQRRDEIGAMAWDEIDADGALWSIPGSRTKNSRDHDVPLSPKALEILQPAKRGDRGLVFGRGKGGFSGWSKAKAALDKRIAESWPAKAKAFEPWTIHDLRRTVATIMAESPKSEGDARQQKRIGLGIAPHVVEAVLNHISGTIRGVGAVYNRATYEPEKRQALDRWAAHLDSLVRGTEHKVLAMQRSA